MSLDSASSRLWWIVELLELVDERLPAQSWHSQFWSLHIDSLTMRILYLIVPKLVSTLLGVLEIHRIDLQHDDDDVEVHDYL